MLFRDKKKYLNSVLLMLSIDRNIDSQPVKIENSIIFRNPNEIFKILYHPKYIVYLV